jgi:acetyltransferase-like isoleucine patch superfamily enzyme
MRMLVSVLILVVPWRLRRHILIAIFGYKIHRSARIGFSMICPQRLEMGPGAYIGHLTVCKGISLLKMDEESFIGNLNWITGFPASDKTFFGSEHERRPELVVCSNAAITNRHIIDCTNSVRIGKFATFAGYRSQVLTHSIDLYQNRQASKPITVGEYSFVGSGSILLGGSALPDYSILGANSVLNKALTDRHFLYAGNPARAVKELSPDMAYFHRSKGLVH